MAPTHPLTLATDTSTYGAIEYEIRRRQETFSISNPYQGWQKTSDRINEKYDAEIRRIKKHNATCALNRKKRKAKRK
jgi:hypothetical protein